MVESSTGQLQLKRSKSIPLHRQISKSIEGRIRNGELSVGVRLSTDNELAEQLGTSPLTVAKAYSELAKQGLISRTRGRGTFVSRNRSHTGKVLFTSPHMNNIYTLQLVHGIGEGLRSSNRDTMMRGRDFGASKELAVVESVSSSDVDGIITTGSLGSYKAYLDAIERGLVVVVVECVVPEIPFVQSNQIKVGRLAARHLIDLGHKDLCVVCANYDKGRERLFGFQIELAKSGVEIREDRIFYPQIYLNSTLSQEELQAIFHLKPMPTAIFAYNDTVAIQIYHEAIQHGIRVPQELALVGVDNWFSHHGVALTSVDQNIFEVGKQGGILFSKIADEDFQFEPGGPKGIEVDPVLVVRGSTVAGGNSKGADEKK
ncbi:MAG: GntR family transcriptional regulator [Planctomycetota bacterium]